MRIGVTGATGFIGQNLIPVLLERGHNVVATSRDEGKARNFSWFPQVEYVSGNIGKPHRDLISLLAGCDCVVHLAWPGLPNYDELFHIEQNYPESYLFLKLLVRNGLKKLTVAGTCFEYGLKNGCLSEETPPDPVNPYGLAKIFLLRSLEQLRKNHLFQLQWLRLFYQYGPGQAHNSLMGQLDRAILEHETSFKMSRGDQLRDYLHVSATTTLIAKIVECGNTTTVLNVCSGTPISVRTLVENRLQSEKAKIDLQLGYYDYSPHEPMAFWGSRSRLQETIGNT